MRGRNGKEIVITPGQKELVKKLVRDGQSIRQAASRARMSYYAAWKIVNDFTEVKEKVRDGYFEHDPYYIF